MSNINLGGQVVTFSYQHPATGRNFDTLLRNVIKPGVYNGGLLSKVDNTTIAIAPFDCWFNTGTDKACHISTTSIITLTVSSSTPIIYMTYTWSDSASNYIDFGSRAIGSTAVTNEIQLGIVTFSGGNVNSFDYSSRTVGLNDTSKNVYVESNLYFDPNQATYFTKSASNNIHTPNNISIGGSVTGNLNITGNVSAANIDNDNRLTANSSTKLPTQYAVKYYVDNPPIANTGSLVPVFYFTLAGVHTYNCYIWKEGLYLMNNYQHNGGAGLWFWPFYPQTTIPRYYLIGLGDSGNVTEGAVTFSNMINYTTVGVNGYISDFRETGGYVNLDAYQTQYVLLSPGLLKISANWGSIFEARYVKGITSMTLTSQYFSLA